MKMLHKVVGPRWGKGLAGPSNEAVIIRDPFGALSRLSHLELVVAKLGLKTRCSLYRWENHRKTMGKPWENGGLMGFNGI